MRVATLVAIAMLAAAPVLASPDIAYCPAPMVAKGKLKGWGGVWGPCRHADAARRMEWKI